MANKYKVPQGVTSIIYDNTLGDTPAKCNLFNRIIRINPEYEKVLNEDQMQFVIDHEAGHINLQTRNEKMADAYASNKYLASGRSPKQSVFAMTKVFKFANNEQHERLEEQLKRAAEHDYKITRNPNALKILNKMNENLHNELDEFENEEQSFLGFKKKTVEQKAVKKAATKAKVKGFVNGAVTGLADNGLVGAVGGALAGARNSAPQNQGGTPPPQDAPEEKKILGMKATTFYIAAAATVIVVTVVLILVFKPKKQAALA